MSETSARASRLALRDGSCERNGLAGRPPGPVGAAPGREAAGAADGGGVGWGREGAAGRGGAPPTSAGPEGAIGRDCGDAGGCTGREAGAGLGATAAGAIGAGGGGWAGAEGGGDGGAAATGAAAGGAGGGSVTGWDTGVLPRWASIGDAPFRLTAKTALQTAQRARTPPSGTLAGSTR